MFSCSSILLHALSFLSCLPPVDLALSVQETDHALLTFLREPSPSAHASWLFIPSPLDFCLPKIHVLTMIVTLPQSSPEPAQASRWLPMGRLCILFEWSNLQRSQPSAIEVGISLGSLLLAVIFGADTVKDLGRQVQPSPHLQHRHLPENHQAKYASLTSRTPFYTPYPSVLRVTIIYTWREQLCPSFLPGHVFSRCNFEVLCWRCPSTGLCCCWVLTV